MLNRLMQIPAFLKGELIVLRVDKKGEKLTVDAGNKSAAELKTAATTLFKKAYNLGGNGKLSPN